MSPSRSVPNMVSGYDNGPPGWYNGGANMLRLPIGAIRLSKKERTMMDKISVAFYVLFFLGFVQIDRRLYDIIKALKPTVATKQPGDGTHRRPAVLILPDVRSTARVG